VIEGAQEPVPEMAYVTGHDGHAQVGLPPGLATIRFFLPDGTTQTALVDVDPTSARTYPVRLGT